MILVEITAAIDEYGSLRTFYLGTDGYQSGPTDAPANTAFDAVLIDPGYIGLSAFSDGKTEGASQLQTGDIVIGNADGEYDGWKDYSFDGRPVVIRRGEGGEYPADFETIFTGTVESVVVDLTKAVVRIKDKAAIFDLPVLTTKYAGTNVGATGLEGTADDIKGRVKPRVYGKVFNVAPPCVNTSKLTYQVSDRAVSQIVAKVQGRAWTAGANYATSALLTAASLTPSSATYATCLAEGLFRLSDDPGGLVTADATEAGTDEPMTAAQIMWALAEDSGLSGAELDEQEFAELDADAPYVIGLYVDDERTFREALDRAAGSVGAWYNFDTSGVFRCGQLKAPGAPVADLIEADVLRGFNRDVADRDGIPTWRVTVRYRRNVTTQTTDLAGAVTAAERAALAQEYRTVVAEDPAIKNQWTKAPEIIVETALTEEADAQAEADRLLALHKVRRDLFDTPLSTEALDQGALDIMETASLTHSRFGLAGGRPLRILGRRLELGKRIIRLKLWG